LTDISLSNGGDKLGDASRSEWTRGRKILYWCERRTRKLVELGAVLTVVAVIIKVILRIAKFASRFSPPAAADFSVTYYKAQDILKRVATTTAIISSVAALINIMCAERLDALLSVQQQIGAEDVDDFGDVDPNPFFTFDTSEFENRLLDIQHDLNDLNKTRAPQTQHECDAVFAGLDAINTLDSIVVDVTDMMSNPFIMAQYGGAEDVISGMKERIKRIRASLNLPQSDVIGDGELPTDLFDVGGDVVVDVSGGGLDSDSKIKPIFTKGSGV